MNNYQKTIGIEVHCELKTKTKMFSDTLNSYEGSENSHINTIDLAYPGTLPLINHGAVQLALKAALLFHCDINKTMSFDRKNYFYPDLPKGYQITQARTPIGINGYVMIEVQGEKKKVRIHDIHIEEDTAKSIHQVDKSYLDFNRSGVPLIEIVTEPDMHTEEEAMAYLHKLRELLVYADISDCKMEEGSMRCDVNVSVSMNEQLGVRTETKNIGSISSVGKAIKAEAKRQIEALENGEKIVEETRRFDEKDEKTILMRVKETGNDYRYFPEPNIPEFTLTEEEIEEVKQSIPKMPDALREEYHELNVNENNIKTLIAHRELCSFFEQVKEYDSVITSNLLTGDVLSYLNKNNLKIKDIKLTKEHMRDIVQKIHDQEISSKQVKKLLPILMEKGGQVAILMNELGMVQISDDHALQQLVDQVIADNPASVEDFKNGKDRAIKYLMGQIMKASRGQANPVSVNRLLLDTLNKGDLN